MRRGEVYNDQRLAGVVEELDDGRYRFTYSRDYLADESMESISLTLPKRQQPYVSDHLFSFFYGLLSEGANRRLQCRLLGIDEDDSFGLLLATAGDTIGSVRVISDEP